MEVAADFLPGRRDARSTLLCMEVGEGTPPTNTEAFTGKFRRRNNVELEPVGKVASSFLRRALLRQRRSRESVAAKRRPPKVAAYGQILTPRIVVTGGD